jgi:hypothetical protein
MTDRKSEIVAVIKGPDGAPGDAWTGGRVEFWEKGADGSGGAPQGGFRLERTMELEPLGRASPKEARVALNRLAEALAEARFVAAKAFPGLTRYAISKAGPALIELPRFEPGWLEELLRAVEDPSPSWGSVATAPVESPPDSGLFQLDLSAALAAAPELSSKKILKAFFETRPFLELRVYFDHAPPWLFGEIERRGLEIALDKRGRGVLMTIFPTCRSRA